MNYTYTQCKYTYNICTYRYKAFHCTTYNFSVILEHYVVYILFSKQFQVKSNLHAVCNWHAVIITYVLLEDLLSCV